MRTETCGDDPAFPPGNRGVNDCLTTGAGTQQPGSKLGWVPLKVDVQEDGTLNVFWKGSNIVSNVHTTFGPRPGRILFGASTGGAMEFVGIDNIHIVTHPATSAVIGNPTVLPNATGFTIDVTDSGGSIVNVTPANTTLKLDGTVVTGWTSSKTGPTTTITYILPGGALFASATTHPVDLATMDGTGATISKSGTLTVFQYNTLNSSLAVTGVDKTKPGFAVKVWQSFHGLANHNDHYDRVLHGESGKNVADLTQSGPDGNPLGADGSFAEPGAIDYAADAVSLGHFSEVQMPGFPSQILPDHQTDMAALEAFTYVDMTAGFQTMYVRSDDGFRVLAGRNLHDRFQIDSLNMGEFDGGRGASDTTFKFYVKDPGTYAFRLIWQNQGGGANVEWGTVESDGSPHLLNGTFDTNGAPDSVALKAYRVGPTSKRAYISSIRPGVRSAAAGTGTPSIRSGIVLGEAGDPLVVTVVDGDTTHLVDGSGHLTVNGSDVTGSTTFNRVGATTTITWMPAGGLLFNTDYNSTLRYDEDTTPAGSLVTRTQSWNSFVWSEVMPLDLPTNSFWIEAEDFDFNSGQTLAAASTMPYTGDAYLNNGGAVFGIDYLNDDNQDSTLYRTNNPPSGDLSVAGKGVNIDRPTPFGRWGGTRPGPVTMTANYKIGWIGGPDWFNYTRTIPAGTYTAYSAQSYDGDGFGQLHGRLALVTAGVGTANQTLQDLGFFDARGSGGWGMNDVVSMQNPVGRHAYFKLPGGQVTLRFFGDSGDFDWFILVPANNVTPQIVARTPAPGDTVAANAPIVIKVQDFTTTLNPASVNLTINGTDVSAGVVKNKVGDTTTLTYTPNPLLAPGASTYVISYADSLGTPTTLQVNFTVTPSISIGLVNGKPTITFTGTLLSSPTVGGTYSPVAGATSPYTVTGGGQTGFYRSTQ